MVGGESERKQEREQVNSLAFSPKGSLLLFADSHGKELDTT